MIDLVKWLNNVDTNNTHPVIIAAVFHVRFAPIHPFRDGNGRMARLMTNAILLSTNYIPITVGGGEVEKEYKQAQYYENLSKFTLTYNMSYFIHFILEGELASSSQLVKEMDSCDNKQWVLMYVYGFISKMLNLSNFGVNCVEVVFGLGE